MNNQNPVSSLVLIGVAILSLGGCSQSLRWVTEASSTSPSCMPDRLPNWTDFARRQSSSGTPAAQTAVQFLLNDSPPYLLAKFDAKHSWVRPQIASPSNPSAWKASEQLLAHEQVHYLISCLLTRQANLVLQSDEQPMAMLELVNSVP